MEDEGTQEWEDKHARDLRQARAVKSQTSGEEVESAETSENQEDEKAAENNTFWLSIISDTLGAIPFIGGGIRALAGLAIHFQALKLNAAIRTKTLAMNGLITLLQILLSFFGLNVLPLASLGRMFIRRVVRTTAQTDTS